MRSAYTGIIKKLLFALYLSVVVFALLEIGVRLSGYSEHHITDPIYMSFAPAQADIPYVHKPNLSNARARGLAVINTDSLGLRSMTAGEQYASRQANEYRIAVAGDSVTFGEGVSKTEDTFAQVLEDTLNQKQSAVKVKVFNFAASAYSVQVMAATLRHRMLEVEPNLVLMAIVPPDFNLSRTPFVDSWGYLSDKKLSGFLPEGSNLRLPLRKIHTLYLLRDLIYPRLDRSEKAEDVIAAGGVPDSYSFVKEFKETAEQREVAYAVVLLPSLQSEFGNVTAQLGRDGASFVDLSTLRAHFTPEQFRAGRFDTHPSAAVHRRIGESLAEYILDRYLMQ
jgi:lysophospholipase L1-like esterase